MIGFAVGVVCLAALFAMHRKRHWSTCGGPQGRYGSWHDDEGVRGGGRRWGVKRFFLRRILEKLDTTPGQEKVIHQAVEEVSDSIRAARTELDASRADIARSLGGEEFDAGALGTAYARQDDALRSIRDAVTRALASVHDALDARQRETLAKLITELPRPWRGEHGPYRS